MTTKQLYYLVTISDAGNLSKAAQVLKISQPALSKFLTDYENSLGLLLFLRYKRQLIPTAAGRYILNCAQKILDEQTRMLQSIHVVTDNNHAVIRLATAPNRGAIIYSRIYKQFSRRYPDIALSLTELYASEQPGAIQHGQIDLAIGSGGISEKVTDLPFAHEELLVSLPAAHPLSSRKSIRLEELKDTPFVLQGSKHSIRLLAEKLFEDSGFNPVVTFESNDVLLVDSMLHQAVGAGLVSQAHVFPCEELSYLHLDPPVYQSLHIRYPLGHELTEPEQYLAGLLIKERLSDPRYQAIECPYADKLLNNINEEQDSGVSYHLSDTFVNSDNLHSSSFQINLNTDVLKYLIAIVDEKSLSRAADLFFLPQPALSRHLKNMEAMLCTKLFTRIHNKLEPTNAGKVFVNFSRNILKMHDEMNQHIHKYHQGREGSFTVLCDLSVLDIINEKVLSGFKELHPDINIYIKPSNNRDIEEALLNATADIGIFFSGSIHHNILINNIICSDELVYFNSEASPFIKDSTISLSDKKPQLKLMLSKAETALREEQNRILELLSDGSHSIECEAVTDVLSKMCLLNINDSILPKHCIPDSAMDRTLCFEEKQDYYLIMSYHPGRSYPPSFTELCEFLSLKLSNLF